MSAPLRVWKGELKGRKTLIAGRSERRTAEILGIPIVRLRDWEQIEYASWMEIGSIYQLDSSAEHGAGAWQKTQ